VSVRETTSYGPAGAVAAEPPRAGRSRSVVVDAVAIAGLIVLAGLTEFFLRDLLTRPFYSDESWRAYDISIGTGFLAHLSTSGAPLALGWVAIENAARVLFGNTEAGLRAPMFVALPGLGVATYLLARRWLGVAVSFCAAAFLLVNSWTVNNALQLKSYSYEGLLAIAAVAAYLLGQRAGWHWARLLLLYVALGLTCVFSVPNLFVVGPLLALDLIQAIRARDRVALRVGGEALAAAIALAHYVFFIRPQAGVASTGFWHKAYAPHQLGPFIRFTIDGVLSYFPGMITGVAGVTNAAPRYRLPLDAHELLAVVVALLACAGIVAAAREAAGRALVVALGGALLLELAGSTMQRWPFGMVRVNLFELPLIYILMAIGAVRLAAALRGRRRGEASPRPVAWWRRLALAVAATGLVAAGLSGGVATARALGQTSQLKSEPVDFSGLRSAVAHARRLATPADLAIIRADYSSPPTWYGDEWLYYMDYYQGYRAGIAARPAIPAANTISVFYVTPAAVTRLLASHPGAPAIFLMEFYMPWGTPSPALHRQSLRTLRRFGYCPASETTYAATGQLTVLLKSRCRTLTAP
jgi:hypothetical protein